ncbi:hypothetical protein [Actinoplanes sp. NPDC051411]|uniref:hypothetical protein n=1 Tax=Actinoplanes sp. NPDC051411 TaxID=3155522 RepID=UPI00342E7980
MLKRLGLLITAAIAMFLPISSGAAYAAYPTAYNITYQTLTNTPANGMPYGYVHRTITLIDDSSGYGWYTYVDPAAHPEPGKCETRTGRIIAGNYDWTDWLMPKDGFYIHQSILTEPAKQVQYVINCELRLDHYGNYWWGSALDPH